MGIRIKFARKLLVRIPTLRQTCHSSHRLAEVGRLEVPNIQGKYDSGQLFLHKIFGYRGVILFPWVARIFDRNLIPKNKDNLITEDDDSVLDANNKDGVESKNSNEEMQYDIATYYQVLIDQRDFAHIRSHPEAVTFLGKDSKTELFAVPGLDYVNHEDILPYISSEKHPIEHKLFNKFLSYDQNNATQKASPSLHTWHKKNHQWLELSDVHRETTENIRVTVIPFYMGTRITHQNQSYWWRYCIRLENLTMEPFRLCERHWRIFSLAGTLETVRGRGVVGQQPVLSATKPAFQYSSHVSLQSASGHMWGTYRMERADGSMFDIRIPPFSLESNDDDPVSSN